MTLEAIRTMAHRLSGNLVEVLEVGQTEVPRLLRSRNALWHDIARDFLVIWGPPLQSL